MEDCIQTCKESLEVSNKREIAELKVERNQQKYVDAHLQSKLVKLEDKVVKIESQSRRDNLLIDGITETENEDCSKKVQEVFKNIMKLENIAEMKIVRCHRLGVKWKESHKPRTVIIKGKCGTN